MYRNFSEGAIRVVMAARKLAEQFRLDEIPADVLMFALIREDEEARKEAYRSGIVQNDLLARITKIKPVSLIPYPITFSPRIADLLERLSVLPEVTTMNLFETILAEIPHGRQPLVTQTPRRTANPRKWFSDRTYELLSGAEADARENGDIDINAHNLAIAAAQRLDWLPKDLGDGIIGVRPSRDGGVALKTQREIVLSYDASNVLCLARQFAESVGAETIEAQHILWAALDVMKSDLKRGYVNAMFAHSQQSTDEKSAPQMVRREDGLIWMTPRVHAMLLRARELAKGKEPTSAQYLRALYEEAATSEVDFMTNRDDKVGPVIQSLPVGELALPMKYIVELAVRRATQLGGPRLDINHIALALLAEDDAAVTQVVNAIVLDLWSDDPVRRKTILKRRLEQCLLHQRHTDQVAVDPDTL